MTDSREFTADDISRASDGLINKTVLQNWHARRMWLAYAEEDSPGHGRQRVYTYAHVLEATLRAHIVRITNFSHDQARLVIVNRLRGALGVAGGWVGDMADKFMQLPDFRDDDCIWVIVEGATIPLSRNTSAANILNEFAIGCEEGQYRGCAILDVSSITRRVRGVLGVAEVVDDKAT